MKIVGHVENSPHLSFATTIDHSPAFALMWLAGLFILMQAAMGKEARFGWQGKDAIERFLMSGFAFILIARGLGVFYIGSINLLSLGIALMSFLWQGWALMQMFRASFRARRERDTAMSEMRSALDSDPGVPSFRSAPFTRN